MRTELSVDERRIIARSQIKNALEKCYGHRLKEIPDEKAYDYVYESTCHKKLSVDLINAGVVMFMILTGISSGSCARFNLYRLLNNYLLCPEKRFRRPSDCPLPTCHAR